MSLLLAMEGSWQQLKCLNYEASFVRGLRQRPVGRHEFCYPAPNPSLQFNHFVALVKWLIGTIKGTGAGGGGEEGDGGDDDGGGLELDEFDDPNAIVGKMTLVLQGMGFEADFPVTRLKKAHGGAAVAVLDFLADKALEAGGFEFREPVYGSDVESAKDRNDEEEGVDEDDIVDETESLANEDVDFADDGAPTADDGTKYDDPCGRDSSRHQIITSKIDPALWRAELERVAPRLRVRGTESSTEDWRNHLDQMKSHERNIAEKFPAMEASLEQLGKNLSSALEHIETKEDILNAQFHSVVKDYAEAKNEMESLEDRHRTVSSKVSELSNELAEVVETLEEVKAVTQEKGNSMTDTTPLVQMKQALTKLKAEIKEFDLRIGVMSHTLLQSQLLSANPQEHSPRQDEAEYSSSDEDDGLL